MLTYTLATALLTKQFVGPGTFQAGLELNEVARPAGLYLMKLKLGHCCCRPLALDVCAGLSKWLCNQLGQSLQKYFLRRKIFLAEKNLFLAEKYISCGKKKYISCGKKIYFLRRKIYFLRKKYISCGEKYISCGEKYFLRKKIFLAEKKIFLAEKYFCTMLPISFRSTHIGKATSEKKTRKRKKYLQPYVLLFGYTLEPVTKMGNVSP